MAKGKRVHSLVTTSFLCAAVFFSLFCPSPSKAAGLTLEEAIRIGLAKNDDLRKNREEIAGLERQLSIIRAQQSWQVELGADYEYSSPENGHSRNTSGAHSPSEEELRLSVSKSYPYGLTVQPGITVTEDETGFSLKVSQSILPFVPTSLQQQYFKTAQELLKARENLEQQKAVKIHTWLGKYLEICRLLEKRELYEKNRRQAEQNLENVMAWREINEAGAGQVLAAQISLEDADYLLQEIDYRINEAESSLLLELSLADDTELIFTADEQFLQDFKDSTIKLAEEYLRNREAVSLLCQANYELLMNQIDQEVLKQELTWLKRSTRTGLDLIGSYNTNDWDEDFTIGLTFTYKLYDGGKRRLELEEKVAKLQSKEADYHSISQRLELQFYQQVNTLNLLQRELEKARLSWEKSKFEAEVAKHQWELGFITYQEYEEYWLHREEAAVQLRALADRLFLEKINFVKAVNVREITGGFNDE